MDPLRLQPPRITRYEESRAVPWRNGRGTTRVLRARGTGRDEWWVSVADLVTAGPFSDFAGVDRIFTPIGAAVRLVVDGVPHDVPAERPMTFSGEAAVAVELPHGPSRALNVFAARACCRVTVQVNQVHGLVSPNEGALVVLGGAARLADGRCLGPLDLVEGPAEVVGSVLVVTLTPAA